MLGAIQIWGKKSDRKLYPLKSCNNLGATNNVLEMSIEISKTNGVIDLCHKVSSWYRMSFYISFPGGPYCKAFSAC